VKNPVEITLISQETASSSYSSSNGMSSWLGSQFIPDAITAIFTNTLALSRLSELSKKYSFFKGREPKDKSPEKEMAYVCRNFTCSLPITSVEGLQKELKL
jgi:uncharacterized protein YyaL (SSP411 family)